MRRKIKRTPSYEATLQISNDAFMKLPRAGQSGFFMNRILKEVADELEHLDSISDEVIAGVDSFAVMEDRTQGELDDDAIMEDWQAPVMRRMAELACASHGDVLEIGFGRGVGSDFIQACGVASHTVIECNDSVVERFHRWREDHSGADIRLAHGLWQDELPKLGQFDGLFFHTYPLNEDDFIEQVAKSSTFAEHFFEHAARHLKPRGVFVYLTMEGDSIGRAHQRALLRHFSSVSLSVLDGLDIPSDTRDAHWVNQMLMVAAVK